MNEQWADYSQTVTADQLDGALRAGGFDAVLHYVNGTAGFVLRVEQPDIVIAIRQLGWPQAGIDVPASPGAVDGSATASIFESVYGFPPRSRLYLDIEPVVFAQAPAAWPAAADSWCDAVRAAGFSPGVYGTDVTVAACANHADTIWRAKPGACDPAGPGLASDFFAGARSVQCSSGTWNGVEMDVSFAQFSLRIPSPPLGVPSMINPVDPSRWDDLYVRPSDAHVMHTWGGSSNRNIEDWGGVGIAGTALCEWTPDGQHLLGRVQGVDGLLYYRQVNISGAVEFDWTATPGQVGAFPGAGGAVPAHKHPVTTTGTSGDPV